LEDIIIAYRAMEETAVPFPYLKMIDRTIEDITITEFVGKRHCRFLSKPTDRDRPF
jgi:hypothetical protein